MNKQLLDRYHLLAKAKDIRRFAEVNFDVRELTVDRNHRYRIDNALNHLRLSHRNSFESTKTKEIKIDRSKSDERTNHSFNVRGWHGSKQRWIGAFLNGTALFGTIFGPHV